MTSPSSLACSLLTVVAANLLTVVAANLHQTDFQTSPHDHSVGHHGQSGGHRGLSGGHGGGDHGVHLGQHHAGLHGGHHGEHQGGILFNRLRNMAHFGLSELGATIYSISPSFSLCFTYFSPRWGCPASMRRRGARTPFGVSGFKNNYIKVRIEKHFVCILDNLNQHFCGFTFSKF